LPVPRSGGPGSCARLDWGRYLRAMTQALNDTIVRPLCVHRLRHQRVQTSTAEHSPQWRNGRTSTERYSNALWSTKEQIIPPPLNQRVRGSSPWRRTPSDLRFLRDTGPDHRRSRHVVYPSCVHRSATGLTALATARPTHRNPRLSQLLHPRRACDAAGYQGLEAMRELRNHAPTEGASSRASLFLMLRDVGIQVLTPVPSSTPRQPDGSRSDAHLLAIGPAFVE
jgi:hypothetical protein